MIKRSLHLPGLYKADATHRNRQIKSLRNHKFRSKMSEMIDKVFSTKLAEQMTGFYGKQKMLRKLNNKLEMNN